MDRIFKRYYIDKDARSAILKTYEHLIKLKNNDTYVHFNDMSYVSYVEMLIFLKSACNNNQYDVIMNLIEKIHCGYNVEKLPVAKNIEWILCRYLYYDDCIEGYKMLFSKNKKLKQNTEGSYLPENSKINFKKIIHYCEDVLTDINSIDEKISFIEFLSTVIKRDIKYSYLSETLTSYYGMHISIPYFFSARDKTGNIVFQITADRRVEEKDLTDDDIIVSVNNPKKVITALKDVRKNGFRKTSNVSVSYYENIGIGFVNNGFHHSAIGSVLDDSAKADVEIVDDTILLASIYTDGLNWYLKSNNQKLYFNNGKDIKEIKCNDFRYAVLFKLAQIKLELISNT